MYLFAGFMLLVAVFGWLYIPDVQIGGPRDKANTCIPSWWAPNKTLEVLAEGRAKMSDEEKVGSKERLLALRGKVRQRFGRK